MNGVLIVAVMNTSKRTPLLFIGLLSLATFAAAAISNESPAQDTASRSNSSSEKAGKMAGLKSSNVLADIAREMVMRSTTNSQVGTILQVPACVLKIKQTTRYFLIRRAQGLNVHKFPRELNKIISKMH
jgi:hypothetical protein